MPATAHASWSPARVQALQQQAADCFAQGLLDEALACIDALQAPLGTTPTWHFNRAILLGALRRQDEALACLTQAQAAGMPPAEVACQEGVLWQALGAGAQALACYARALAHDPEHAQSWLNRGALLLARKDPAGARDALMRARQALPDAPGLEGACWLARRQLAQWDADTDALAQAVVQRLPQGQPVAEPFTLLALADDPALQRQAAALWPMRPQARLAARAPAAVAAGPKLRIGYFSSDFHDHATLHLLAGVLEAHDRQAFEVVCFSWGPPTRDAYQRRAMAAADAFIEVQGLTDVAVADQARALEIDIAIDLKGATHDARPGIFAARAAPVQVNYLGYPGTLALPWWDYLVADAIVVPPAHHGDYSEQIACLPHCYQPNDRRRIRPTDHPSRAECGLPTDAVVLASFHALYKLGPAVWACWMQILQQVPQAVLWVLADGAEAQQHLRAQARAAGVDPARLVFAPTLPQARHLARLALADLVLDTWPCNAHTTASDALWMGVPVLTRVGRSFAARVAASTLHAVGLDALICRDAPDYVAQACALARQPAQLRALRQHLEQQRLHTPLFDTVRYTRSLEAAWQAMVARARAGRAPAHFRVEER